MTTPNHAAAPSLAYLVCECCLVLVPPKRGSGRCWRCWDHESRGFTCSSKAPPTKEGRGKEKP